MCELFLDVLSDNRAKGRFEIHEFVLMPNHFHALLTPTTECSLEKAVQYIKGGFSFRAKRDLGFNGEIWQAGYNEHRVKDAVEYEQHAKYIHENPVRAGMVERAEQYKYSSASKIIDLDPAPKQFRG